MPVAHPVFESLHGQGGKYGNCEPVARLGVLSAHCPDGLTGEVWRSSIEAYATRKAAGKAMGHVIRAGRVDEGGGGSGGGGADASGLVGARVLKYLPAKGFGFVQLDSGGDDVFFHKRALDGAAAPSAGARVQVALGTDRRGRRECRRLVDGNARGDGGGARARGGGGGGRDESRGDGIAFPCFSMNQPFAGLIAHGTKTIESRNHTMFEGTEGQYAALHVGQRTYPDGGKHLTILRRAGLADEEIGRITQLPDGFARGNVVAIVELGPTRISTLDERSEPDIEHACCAYGADAGRYLTEVKAAHWLTRPVPMSGRPGIFDITVPRSALPEELLQKVTAPPPPPKFKQTYG